jgi:hypothetical protein
MVPAVGDTDLSATDVAFRESRAPRVQAYMERVCLPEVTDEATSAAFVDFLARAGAEPDADGGLDALLLQGTRSAAASRFAVAVPMGHPELALSAECRAMPELLATHANGESPGDEQLIADHLVDCAICAHTLTRMQAAEQAFAAAASELPALEVKETRVNLGKARPRPARPSASASASASAPTGARPPSRGNPQPSPQPESRSNPGIEPVTPATRQEPPPASSRRRSGGLVGAIRRFGRPQP